MKINKISISSWTSSFRVSNSISGNQNTYKVPPLSTVFGLISAAKGDLYIPKSDLKLGYFFDYQTSADDVEKIYYHPANGVGEKSNVVFRNQLFFCRLIIYTSDYEIANYFQSPKFPILLGRSSDVATVDEISLIEVTPKKKLDKVTGTIVPFQKSIHGATIFSLPVFFFNETKQSRKLLLVDNYFMLDYFIKRLHVIEGEGFTDDTFKCNDVFCSHCYENNYEVKCGYFSSGIDIYWQDLSKLHNYLYEHQNKKYLH